MPGPRRRDLRTSRLSSPPAPVDRCKATALPRAFHNAKSFVSHECKKTGMSGYARACANVWRPGVCAKPRIKCAESRNRELSPLSDAVLFKHLAADHTVGAYPLLTDDTCHLLAVDLRAPQTLPRRGFSSTAESQLGMLVSSAQRSSGDLREPWNRATNRATSSSEKLTGDLPERLTLTLSIGSTSRSPNCPRPWRRFAERTGAPVRPMTTPHRGSSPPTPQRGAV